jgi:hypothetical protein
MQLMAQKVWTVVISVRILLDTKIAIEGIRPIVFEDNVKMEKTVGGGSHHLFQTPGGKEPVIITWLYR